MKIPPILYLPLFGSAALLTLHPGCTGCGSNRGFELDPDSLTSATPEIASVAPTSAHEGWGDPSCFPCHDTIHTSGFREADCANCHGNNGAPLRPSGHDDLGCANADCHPGRHQGMGFGSPNDCRACHRYPEPATGTCSYTEEYDAVVVGAGGGGLAAAAHLAREGKHVLLLEKNYKVGGQMTNFTRLDYHFEVSLHAMDFMGISLVNGLGGEGKITPVRAEPYMYRVVAPDFTIDVPADVDEYRAALQRQFPDETHNIDAIFDELGGLSGAGSGNLSAYEVLSLYTQDERLISVLTILSGFLGVSPKELSGAFFTMGMLTAYNISGYHYLIGGSQSMSNALAGIVEEHGGTIKLNTRATKIVIENGRAVRVKTADGGCYDTGSVVSNANAPDTFFRMIGKEHLPAEFIEEVESREIGLSIFAVYLGVDRDYADLFPEGSHEIMVLSSYDIDEHYRAAADCRPEDTTYGIANYSVVDPTSAPAGKSVIVLTSQLGYDCYHQWDWASSYQSYKDYKLAAARVYIERAEEFLPGLSNHIEVLEVATPATIEGYTLNPRGTIFGWKSYTKDLSLVSLGSPATPIPNVFLAGAWVMGGGQTPSMLTGLMAASAVLDQ